ncbi:MAG: hypothetical protein IPL35_09670 [Sphingobacteriales bacterium]|nr:hypothetical protein [Sphingobacteriales bacterium]
MGWLNALISNILAPEKFINSLNSLVSNFKDKQKEKIQLFALERVEQISGLLASAVSVIIIGMVAFMAYFFGIITLTIYLASFWGALGAFAALTMFHVVLLLIFIIFRESLLEFPIFKAISDKFVDEIMKED